jgi:hypothetical protein
LFKEKEFLGRKNEAVSKLVEKVGDGLFYAMEADF